MTKLFKKINEERCSMKINDKCEAFDWAWALWYWLSNYHEGQFSDKYMAMCSIPVDNVPDINFDENDCDDYEQAVQYYHDINEDNWKVISYELDRYLEEEWDNE